MKTKKTNYANIVKQTHKEKVKMYMKCTKNKLIEMLIECNRIKDLHSSNYFK